MQNDKDGGWSIMRRSTQTALLEEVLQKGSYRDCEAETSVEVSQGCRASRL